VLHVFYFTAALFKFIFTCVDGITGCPRLHQWWDQDRDSSLQDWDQDQDIGSQDQDETKTVKILSGKPT